MPPQQEKLHDAATAAGKSSSGGCGGGGTALMTHLRDIPVAEEHSPALATFDAEADYIITAPSVALSPQGT